jgi:hypothetical protein
MAAAASWKVISVRARKAREQIVAEFNHRSLHDDTLHALRVIPALTRRQSSRVEVDLTEYVTNKPRRLCITGCVNISFVAYFNVLVDNAYASTDCVLAIDDEERIRQIITDQIAHLNLNYVTEIGEPSEYHPTEKKLKDLSAYVLFRILFFGGTLEVIARGFKITRPRILATAADTP